MVVITRLIYLNGSYYKTNLPKIKDGTYLINLDEYKSKGTHFYVF